MGEFVHFTARPVGGSPDPHLHAHCFVFNTTWDGDESRWKAGQFADLKRDAPFFEAVFHSRLARKLEELGLPTQRTKKGWELCDLPTAAIQKFSRRTALIERAAEEQGVSDPEAKSELGAKTRERKQMELSLDELQQLWAARMTQPELDAVTSIAVRLGGPTSQTMTSEARERRCSPEPVSGCQILKISFWSPVASRMMGCSLCSRRYKKNRGSAPW